MEKLPDLKTLTSDEKDALIVTLYELVVELRLIVQQQAEELEKIKGQLSKNSQNSSKSPSSDGLLPPPKVLEIPAIKTQAVKKDIKGIIWKQSLIQITVVGETCN